jgi:2-polyprenyl-6-methoxyphenol hydroxylase-like FAD-dependent oxidoreductase
MKVMSRIGVADAIAQRGVEVSTARITDFRGKTLTGLDFSALPRDIGRAIAIHRAALHEAILTGVDSGSIRLGTTVETIDEGADDVAVRLSDGSEDRFDLVVGADGIRSSVRTMAFGEIPLLYSGYTCWRFVVDTDIGNADTWEMWGPGRRFGVVPIGREKTYCFTTFNAAHNDTAMRDITLDRFKELFADFRGPVPEILCALTTADALIWNDLEEIEVPQWTTQRVVLLGDAAHAMTPNMGQGAAMAIEDASVLADVLGDGPSVNTALTQYEQRRRPRVSQIQTRSRRLGRVAQWQSAPACAIRNILVGLTPESVGRRAIEELARFEP